MLHIHAADHAHTQTQLHRNTRTHTRIRMQMYRQTHAHTCTIIGKRTHTQTHTRSQILTRFLIHFSIRHQAVMIMKMMSLMCLGLLHQEGKQVSLFVLCFAYEYVVCVFGPLQFNLVVQHLCLCMYAFRSLRSALLVHLLMKDSVYVCVHLGTRY
jgi:hypothetical protein